MGLRQEPGTSQLVVDNMIVVTQLFDGLSIMCKDTNWSMFRGVQYTSKYYPVTLAGGFHCIVEYIVVSGSLPATSTGADTVHIRSRQYGRRSKKSGLGTQQLQCSGWVAFTWFHQLFHCSKTRKSMGWDGMRWIIWSHDKPCHVLTWKSLEVCVAEANRKSRRQRMMEEQERLDRGESPAVEVWAFDGLCLACFAFWNRPTLSNFGEWNDNSDI